MAIDRVHWKVGDWVLIIGKGRREIKSIDDDGVCCLVRYRSDGSEDNRKFSYNEVSFAGPAESVGWKRGDVVYVDGVTPIRIEYCEHHYSQGPINYVEWNGDWNDAYADRLTAIPLDPELVERAKLRDARLAHEEFLQKLSKLSIKCPAGTSDWIAETIERFKNKFGEQLRGEKE